MAFSYSAVWDDTMQLVRSHGHLLAAVAGVFLFLPALLFAQYLPPPEVTDPDQAWAMLMDYYERVLPWLIGQSLLNMVGTAAMLRLALARGTSVGAALGFGLMLLPFYFLLSLLMGLIVGFGMLLLIVPGLYLAGRLVPAAPVMVAENRRNPLDVIGRSFALTKGRGWAVFGLVFVVVVVAFIVLFVAVTLLGLAFTLAAGPDLGRLLASVVTAAGNAAIGTLAVMLYVAIYRALSGHESTAATFE